MSSVTAIQIRNALRILPSVTCDRCGSEVTQPLYVKVDTRAYRVRRDRRRGPEYLCEPCGLERMRYSRPTWFCCQVCGREGYATRPRLYCTPRCQATATVGRLERYREARRSVDRSRCCATCGEQFTPPRSDGRYCSPVCRQKAYRARKGGTP